MRCFNVLGSAGRGAVETRHAASLQLSDKRDRRKIAYTKTKNLLYISQKISILTLETLRNRLVRVMMAVTSG